MEREVQQKETHTSRTDPVVLESKSMNEPVEL